MKNCKHILIFLSTTLLLSIFPIPAMATEEFAEKTGAACEVCHLDPLGGGDLSEVGKGYRMSVAPEKSQRSGKQALSSRIFRLALLYIHVIAAFMWFGTILYVHLVLKPAYASKGLPGGEVKVGLISMGIMAITGTILTCYKLSSVNQLLSSTFGRLLLAKITIFTIMAVSALFVVYVIGPKLKKKKMLQTVSSPQCLTLNDLNHFDGEEGRPAYLAYKGRIYDVSRSKLWRSGKHMKRHLAGVDLSDALAQAPHGEDKILSMPEVCPLSTQDATRKQGPPEKVFYLMAYMNLVLVFIVALLLALWRW